MKITQPWQLQLELTTSNKQQATQTIRQHCNIMFYLTAAIFMASCLSNIIQASTLFTNEADHLLACRAAHAILARFDTATSVQDNTRATPSMSVAETDLVRLCIGGVTIHGRHSNRPLGATCGQVQEKSLCSKSKCEWNEPKAVCQSYHKLIGQVFQFRFLAEHIAYVQEQIWELEQFADGYLIYYSLLSHHEYSFLQSIIPVDFKVLVDLGCGLGRAGTYLYNKYNTDHKRMFIFVDSNLRANGDGGGSSIEHVIDGVVDDATKDDYNNLELTESFVRLNNVENYKILDFQKTTLVDGLDGIGSADVVLSMYSVGLHFDIKQHFQNIVDVLHHNSVVIFGVRTTPTYNYHSDLQQFQNFFDEVKLVQGPKHPFPQQDYLVLSKIKTQYMNNGMMRKKKQSEL